MERADFAVCTMASAECLKFDLLCPVYSLDGSTLHGPVATLKLV